MRHKVPIGLISAVSFESDVLLGGFRGTRVPRTGVTTGRLGGRDVVHIESGIGIANAAHAATVLLERFSPSIIIQFGIGGAYPGGGLKVGDIAVAELEVYADLGVLGKGGLTGLEAIGLPLLRAGRKKYFNSFPLDGKLMRAALKSPGLQGAVTGVFLTVSQATGTLRRARELRRRHNALCENMEGAAVAHISARYGIPMLEIRGISNMVEDRDPGKWDKTSAAENCQEALRKIVEATPRK